MSTTTGTSPSPGDEDGHARDRPSAQSSDETGGDEISNDKVSDADLWRRAVADDPDSFGVIFDRHGDTIHAYCARRTGRTDEPATRRPLWRRPKLALTSAGGLLAAGLAIVTIVTVSRPLPAYAVSGGNGKEVKVKINRLEGAHALEEALRKKGIAADITYLPSRQRCQPNRYIDNTPRGMSLSVSADRFEVKIPPGAVGTGETFVLWASVTPLHGGTGVSAAVDFGVAKGAIAACTPSDIPAAPPTSF